MLILVGAGDVALVVLAVAFAGAHEIGSTIGMLLIAGGITAAVVSYFRNAALFVTDQEVGKIDIMGRKSALGLDELLRTEARYSPQPSLWFIAKNRKAVFRVNTRL